MASLSLAFDLLARDVNASKTFRDVGGAAERAGKQTNAAGSLMANGMKIAAGALLGGGLLAGFTKLWEQAAESQRVGRLTDAALKSTGGAANVTAKQIAGLADALSKKTGIDDEAIQSGENLILTFGNIKNAAGAGNDIFSQTTAIMADMSVALGQDMKSSALQLGKALNDPIKGVTALQRAGVSFTAQQRDQIKVLVESGRTLDAQKLILAELGKEFGGAAEAAATPMDKLKVSLGNVAEQLGGYLIPFVDKAAKFISNDLLPAASNLAPVFSLIGDALGGMLTGAGDILHFFSDLPGPIKAGAIALGAFVVLRGPLTSLFSSVAEGATNMALRLASSVGSVGGLRTAAGGLLGVLGGPWGVALAGATVGISLLVDWLGKGEEETQASKQATKDYADALREANGVITDTVRTQAAKSAQDKGVLDVTDKLGISASHVTEAITRQGSALTNVRAALQTYIDQHTVAEGRGAQFGATLDEEALAAQRALKQLNVLAGQNGATATTQDQLARAIAGTGNAAAAAKILQDQLTTGLQDSADAASEARSQTDLFKTSLDILTGRNVDLIQVESQLQDALAAGTGAMKNMTGSVLQANGQLDLQSEAGRKAADVLLGVRDSGNQLISTMIQQGATSKDVQAKDAQLRQSFINTAQQMGISKDAALKLADQILGIPGSRTTTIKADTAPARATLNQFIKDFTGYQINAGLVLGRSRLAAAAGGFIAGPGTGRSDSIPAWLSNGEFVVNAASTKQWRPILEAMNARGLGYADGGIADIRDWMSYMITRFGITASSIASVSSQLRAAASTVATGIMGAPTAASGNVALGQALAAARGWTGSQWNALYTLWMHESGWRNTAQNPTSTAYGIPQFLNSTWASTGYGKTSDARTQILAGMNYIASRYGSPVGAWNFWSGHHWYDKGGWLQPGYTLAYNGTGKPERVVPPGGESPQFRVQVFVGNQEIQHVATKVYDERERRKAIDNRSRYGPTWNRPTR